MELRCQSAYVRPSLGAISPNDCPAENRIKAHQDAVEKEAKNAKKNARKEKKRKRNDLDAVDEQDVGQGVKRSKAGTSSSH